MNVSPDPYAHSVGPWQHWTGRLLRRIPFALCGMWLGEEPGVEYPGPDAPHCPACAGQITVRQWFRLPKAERERRVTEFRAADRALQAYEPPAGVPYSDDDPGYVEFNDRVNDLWPTVPWWCRL